MGCLFLHHSRVIYILDHVFLKKKSFALIVFLSCESSWLLT